jgi:hypothetical protein
MSDKKSFKLGSGDTSGKLGELKKTLPEQKNGPEILSTEEKKKLEKIHERISNSIEKIFGDDFKSAVEGKKAFKKDENNKFYGVIRDIKNISRMRAGVEKWYEYDLDDKQLADKLMDCIVHNVKIVSSATKNKTLRGVILDFIDDKYKAENIEKGEEKMGKNVMPEKEWTKKDKEREAFFKLENEFGRIGTGYMYQSEIGEKQKIKIKSYKIIFDKKGEVDWNNTEVLFLRNGKPDRKTVETFRNIAGKSEKIEKKKKESPHKKNKDAAVSESDDNGAEKKEYDTAEYLHLTEKTFGEDGKQMTNLDFAKAVLYSQVGNWKELDAGTPQEREKIINDKIRQFFVEMGVAVHGMVKKDEGKKELVPNEKPDLDGKTTLFLLKKAGIEIKSDSKKGNIKYVIPGTHAIGKITFDSGMVDGVEIRKEQNENGEWVISVIVDHHGETSPRDTSAADVAYQTFSKLGLFEEYFQKDEKNKENLEKLVQFINRIDNFDYPNGKEYFENYFQNSWDTIVGISRMLGPQNFLDFFADGRSIDDVSRSISEMRLLKKDMRRYGILQLRDVKDTEKVDEILKNQQIDPEKIKKGEELTKEQMVGLSKAGFHYDKTRKVIREYVDVRKMQEERVKESRAVLQEMEKDGLIIESDRFGKIAVDIGGRVETGSEAARAFGCEAFVLWNPEYNRFGVNTLGGKELIDSDGNLLANKYNQGVEVRKTMWIKSLAEKDEPLNIKLEDILGELTDGKFAPTGKLKEYIDKNKNDTSKKTVSMKAEDSFIEDEVVQRDKNWDDFVKGVENDNEEEDADIKQAESSSEPELKSELEPKLEPEPKSELALKSSEKPVFEAGSMSLEEFEKLRRELDASREFYVNYNSEFEKKKNSLEKYFGKTESSDFFGQAQEEAKNLKDAYDKTTEKYKEEYLATMRKFYVENDKLEGNALEEAMMDEERYVGWSEAMKREKNKAQVELELEIKINNRSGKLFQSWREIIGDRVKKVFDGVFSSIKRGNDIVQEGVGMATEGIEIATFPDKRRNRKEILSRRQIGNSSRGKLTSVESKAEINDSNEEDSRLESMPEVEAEISQQENVGVDIKIPVRQEKDEKTDDIIDKPVESEIEKKSMEFDPREFAQKVMMRVSDEKNSLWKEMKGKSVEGILSSEDNSKKGEETKIFHKNIFKINKLAKDNLEGKIRTTPEMSASQWLLKVYEVAKKEEKIDEIFSV